MASGDVFSDTVEIGTIIIPSQSIELASFLSKELLTQGGTDGILGLAFPSKNEVKPDRQRTPMLNLMNNNTLASDVFTVMLDKGDSNGFYSFGIIDSARAGVVDDDIFFTPVDSNLGFWMVDSTSVIINGKTMDRPGNKAVVDTGTSACLLDSDTVSAIYNLIPGATFDKGQGVWKYPNNATIPTVQLPVGTAMFTSPLITLHLKMQAME